jgi:hypothetical protein
VTDRLLAKLKPKVRTIPRCHEADESEEGEGRGGEGTEWHEAYAKPVTSSEI